MSAARAESSRTAEKWRRHAGRTQIVPLGNKGLTCQAAASIKNPICPIESLIGKLERPKAQKT